MMTIAHCITQCKEQERTNLDPEFTGFMRDTAAHLEKIKRLAELVEAAYFRGWKDGAETGPSDSPDWNASEDWAETDIRHELYGIESDFK